MSTGCPTRLADQIARQLAGEWQPDLPLDLGGLTAFGGATLRKTMEIPWGEVRPYSWVAREIGRPRAVRAVGSALGNNPLPFLVPCHRVVRADGHIGEYGAGGPAAKRAMLAHGGRGCGRAGGARRPTASGTWATDDTDRLLLPDLSRARSRSQRRSPVRFRSGEDAIDRRLRAVRRLPAARGPVFRG